MVETFAQPADVRVRVAVHLGDYSAAGLLLRRQVVRGHSDESGASDVVQFTGADIVSR